MNLIILGPQGSGKGTQAELLSKKFNLAHIDMGMSLRLAASENNSFGKKLSLIINDKKELVSDLIVQKVLERELKKIPKSKGIIVDGAPRRLGQIPVIEKALEGFGRKIDKVIHLKISVQESVRRISHRYNCSRCHKGLIMGKDVKSPKSLCLACGGTIERRPDDTPSGVRKRLRIYQKETAPVVKYFKKRGKIIETGGARKYQEVFRDIVGKLKKN